jgi:asparagine synthase (glutamine-hydrolysing)
MCGIAGIFVLGPRAVTPSVEELQVMAGALHHRGPDEFGVYRDRAIGLAHARLSIIDLATGQQPLANEDETLWTVFNGEIFNYVELRSELLARGHRFRTQSDTEVIVHAYEEWGDEAFARFNGQYAIALWDAERQKLVLARDRVGVRPLYVCAHAGRLYFASEVKAIFAADPSIPRALCPIGLEQSFTFWTVVPPQTAFVGVSELEPGHVRTYTPGEVSDRAFYRQSYPEGPAGTFRGSVEDAAREVRSALEEATRLRMLRADVPVGSYLSGGLDSSLIAALGLRAKGQKFSTFSLRFEDVEYDETEYQRQMARELGSEHHEVVVSKDDIAAVFPEVMYHAERPILRTGPAPLFLLSRLVKQSGIKVVLTGEGADEMFAGYDLFREAKVRRFWARHPGSTWRPLLLERLYPYLARSPVAQRSMAKQFFGRNLAAFREPGFSHEPRWHSTQALRRFFSAELKERTASTHVVQSLLESLPGEFSRWSELAQDQYLEIRTLLSGYLLSAQGDRMLMGNSIEGRFPFLDANVMALAASLPASYKLHVLDEKHVLKKASVGLVPAAIVGRKKQPYRAPDALAFVGTEAMQKRAAWIGEALSEAAITEAGVFEGKAVTQLWRKCTEMSLTQLSNADNMALVGILSTQLLHQHFVRVCPRGRGIRLRLLVDRAQQV